MRCPYCPNSTITLPDLVRVYRAHAPAYRDRTARIAATDWLIDQIVYKLYGLTEEEIATVAADLTGFIYGVRQPTRSSGATTAGQGDSTKTSQV